MRSASSARWGAADVIQTLCAHGGSAFKPRRPSVEHAGGKRIVPLLLLRFLNHKYRLWVLRKIPKQTYCPGLPSRDFFLLLSPPRWPSTQAEEANPLVSIAVLPGMMLSECAAEVELAEGRVTPRAVNFKTHKRISSAECNPPPAAPGCL